MFEDQFDEEMRDALSLRNDEPRDLSTIIVRQLSPRLVLIDYLVPLMAAAAAILFAWILTPGKMHTPIPNDQVQYAAHDFGQPRVATMTFDGRALP